MWSRFVVVAIVGVVEVLDVELTKFKDEVVLNQAVENEIRGSS